jgi:hypothetical protein
VTLGTLIGPTVVEQDFLHFFTLANPIFLFRKKYVRLPSHKFKKCSSHDYILSNLVGEQLGKFAKPNRRGLASLLISALLFSGFALEASVSP